jgi:hypothetical protein
MPSPVTPECTVGYTWNPTRKCCEYDDISESCRDGQGFWNFTEGRCDNEGYPPGAFSDVRLHSTYFADNSGTWDDPITPVYYTDEVDVDYTNWPSSRFWEGVPSGDTVRSLSQECGDLISGAGVATGFPPESGEPPYCRDASGNIVTCDEPNPVDPFFPPCTNPIAVWECWTYWDRFTGQCHEAIVPIGNRNTGIGCNTLPNSDKGIQYEVAWSDATPYADCTAPNGYRGAIVNLDCPGDLIPIVRTTTYDYGGDPELPTTRPYPTTVNEGTLDTCRVAVNPTYLEGSPDNPTTDWVKASLTLDKSTTGSCYEPQAAWCPAHYDGSPPSCEPECLDGECPPNFTYDPLTGMCIPDVGDHSNAACLHITSHGRRYIVYDDAGTIRIKVALFVQAPSIADHEVAAGEDNFRPYVTSEKADRLVVLYDREDKIYLSYSADKGATWLPEEEFMDGIEGAILYEPPAGGLFVIALRPTLGDPDIYSLFARWKGPGEASWGLEFEPQLDGVGDFALEKSNIDLAISPSDASRRWMMTATKDDGSLSLFTSNDKGHTWTEVTI